MKMAKLSVVFLLASTAITSASVQLTKELMEITRHAAVLSAHAYLNTTNSNYDEFKIFNDEPDQALFAKKDGYCYGVFRGTTVTFDDWAQNFDAGTEAVCDSGGQCCQAREGFVKAYDTTFKDSFEQELRACAATCTNPDECVVLSGHSQGGAVALVAAIALADLNPYAITFGQPPAVEVCDVITSDRVYRYVNTVVDYTQLIGNPDLEYDPIPFSPDMFASTKNVGHLIVLPPPGKTTVAYYGLDVDTRKSLTFNVDIMFGAHTMSTGDYGYLQKIESIISAGNFPVPTGGFVDGTVCIQDDNCNSGICNHLVCKQLQGPCGDCEEDFDCISDKCFWGSCAADNGKMPNECVCEWDDDCESGRCEGTTKWRCEAKLANGASCNEHSDCISGRCSWGFKCVEPGFNPMRNDFLKTQKM